MQNPFLRILTTLFGSRARRADPAGDPSGITIAGQAISWDRDMRHRLSRVLNDRAIERVKTSGRRCVEISDCQAELPEALRQIETEFAAAPGGRT